MIAPPADPSAYRPLLTDRLGVALRFVDAFTSRPVTIPLRVSIPAEGWRTHRGVDDATYRLLVTNAPVPAGTFEVEVEAPGGEYRSLERIQVTLPLTPSAPPPPVFRGDHLRAFSLWPTRRLQPPPGETAVIGRIQSTGGATPVADLRIELFPVGSAPAPGQAGFTRTDEAGEFLFRLPQVRNQVAGTTITPPPDIEIRITDPVTGIIAATPASFPIEPGRVVVRRVAVA